MSLRSVAVRAAAPVRVQSKTLTALTVVALSLTVAATVVLLNGGSGPPAAWAVILSFGGVGAILRRRRGLAEAA